MKITFLGTSHGVPAADRYCSCTMLEVNGSLYFIDAGAPLIDLLLRRGTDLNAIRAIFTTHMHGDHVDGLVSLCDLFNWYFTSTHASVWLTEEEGIRLLRQFVSYVSSPFNEERLPLRLETPGAFYEDENLRVTAIPTRHMATSNRPSYALLVEAEGKRVLFSGDLNLREGDFPACALREPLDMMVMEMAHFEPGEAAPWLEKCTARRMYMQHVFPLEKYSAIRAMSGAYGYPIYTPNDGDEVIL